MINWLKLAKFYKLFYRVPLFWWQYFATHPFPGQFQSLEDLIGFGKRHRMMGLNGQCIRAYILSRVFQRFDCTSFVETGSRHGHTAGFVRRVFKTAVFSCEVSTSNYLISRLNLVWANQVLLFRSDSPDFLRKICRSPLIGSNPMFYLDAHTYNDPPLPDELLIIAERCERAIVVIDDFFIPSDQRFHYDQYPNLRIDLNVINSTLKARRQDALVYLPVYDPSKEGGPGGVARGMAVVLMGQHKELPTEIFPLNLLSPV